jgi:hypothetical protein
VTIHFTIPPCWRNQFQSAYPPQYTSTNTAAEFFNAKAPSRKGARQNRLFFALKSY